MSANHTRMSPRQKMINLMYLILTAMLALNVSNDVLDGFTQVDDGLKKSTENVAARNSGYFNSLEALSVVNPAKAAGWFSRAREVREATERLCVGIDSLKYQIVREADGGLADVDEINNRENIDAPSVVMLSPVTKNGEKLRHSVESYREFITMLLTDSVKKRNIAEVLSTDPVKVNSDIGKRPWEIAKFENQPVVAAVTLLTKLQNDIRYAEGEALSEFLDNVDAGDVRVNSLNAFVIPESGVVMSGDSYRAEIVLAAVDTTSRPKINVNGRYLDQTGVYEAVAGKPGEYGYSGFMEISAPDGSKMHHPFQSSYRVIEPTATVSATMMNILYAGIDNPLSISVPGVPNSDISATMTNGTLTRNSSGGWIARPSKTGADAVVTVSATSGNRQRQIASTVFHVRRLPEPMPFLKIGNNDGSVNRHQGGNPITKNQILLSEGVGAAIDDGVLNIDFKVEGFETVFFDSMGNAIPEMSNGDRFSDRQRQMVRRLPRGSRFFISRITASGPDGTLRRLSPLEVIVN